jgi:hypothetical protein
VAAASGITKLTFVFGDQTRIVPRPPVSSIDRELDRMRQSTELRRQQITAELLAWVYQDCAEGLRVIASMGINPVADFKQVILEQLPDAIGACRCAADDAAVKSLHWALFGNPRPTSGVSVDIASSDAAGATEIARGAEEPWSSAFERVVTLPAPPGAAPVRFTVEAVDEAQHRKTAGDRRGNGPGDRQVPRQ